MLIHLKQHALYYTLLVTFLLLGVGLIVQASYSKTLQITLIVLVSFLYAVVGIIHHFFEHDITAKIVVEYVLTASVGMAVGLLILT